ncbi:MAG: hypothetical protein M0R48_11380 [Candidatus Omnitrophica bacterium]|nr:hypothetical protein [Candidatus Omnitrophota bacterium]
MYSELLNMSKKTTGFLPGSGNRNLMVRSDTVGGNHIKVVIDGSGTFVDVICCKQDTKNKERFILVRESNMAMFPKLNFGPDMISFKNVPTLDSGNTDFSGIRFEIATGKKSVEKTRKFCKEVLLKAFSKEEVPGLFGESVRGYCKADLETLYSHVFCRLIALSASNAIAKDILELFVFGEEGKVGGKIPMIIVCEKDGVLSTDTVNIEKVSELVPGIPKKKVKYGNGTAEIYTKIPPYKFPCIGEKILFSRYEKADALSMNGKRGTEACVIPCDRLITVFDYLDYILPEDGFGRFYGGVNIDKLGSGLLAVVYDEDQFRGDIGEFLYGMTSKEKIAQFRSWQENMIKSYFGMKASNVNSPVNFILFGATDANSNADIVYRLEMSRESVFQRIKDWNDNSLPYPGRLMKCVSSRYASEGSQKVVVKDSGRSFGFDKILRFIFTTDEKLDTMLIRILKDNLKSFCLSVKNTAVKIEDPNLGYDMLKFLKFVLEKKGVVMDSGIKSFGKMCKLSDNLQKEFWKEHQIDNKFGRTIGSEAVNLMYASRFGDAFKHLVSYIQKYLDWAKTYDGDNKNEVDAIVKELKAAIGEYNGVNFKTLFGKTITDVEVAELAVAYLS